MLRVAGKSKIFHQFCKCKGMFHNVRNNTDILLHGKLGNQIVGLEHNPDIFSAVLCQFFPVLLCKLHTLHRNRSCIQAIQPADHIKKRAFSGAGWS